MKLFVEVLAALVGLSAAGPVDVMSKVSKLNERQTCPCWCDGKLYEPSWDSCQAYGGCEGCCAYTVSAYPALSAAPGGVHGY
jgi:hypothetical protein